MAKTDFEGVEVRAIRLEQGEAVPNHPRWPLLVYRRAVGGDAAAIERQVEANGWGGTWRNGVFDYHHYHSTSHEVLAVVSGRARVQFGGPQGQAVELAAGDVAILPAGTGHKRLQASEDFVVVGAYPRGQENYDTQRKPAGEAELRRIEQAERPQADPIFGKDGPLREHWKV